jgi:hypothetical protein
MEQINFVVDYTGFFVDARRDLGVLMPAAPGTVPGRRHDPEHLRSRAGPYASRSGRGDPALRRGRRTPAARGTLPARPRARRSRLRPRGWIRRPAWRDALRLRRPQPQAGSRRAGGTWRARFGARRGHRRCSRRGRGHAERRTGDVGGGMARFRPRRRRFPPPTSRTRSSRGSSSPDTRSRSAGARPRRCAAWRS